MLLPITVDYLSFIKQLPSATCWGHSSEHRTRAGTGASRGLLGGGDIGSQPKA